MIGIDIIDAALLPAMMVAFLGGLLSFLSPCVLPIVPPYLAYMSGISASDLRGGSRKPVLAAAFFVLGLSTVFLILGAAASMLGKVFLSYAEIFNTVAGLIIMAFGLHFLGILRLGFIMREARLDPGAQGGTVFGAYVMGLAFAFGWTPCIGPHLGAILTLAAQEASVGRSMALLGVYAIGMGVPFLALAAFFTRLAPLVDFLKRNSDVTQRIMGLLLWTIGLLMLTGGFSSMSFWLMDTFPALTTLG